MPTYVGELMYGELNNIDEIYRYTTCKHKTRGELKQCLSSSYK